MITTWLCLFLLLAALDPQMILHQFVKLTIFILLILFVILNKYQIQPNKLTSWLEPTNKSSRAGLLTCQDKEPIQTEPDCITQIFYERACIVVRVPEQHPADLGSTFYGSEFKQVCTNKFKKQPGIFLLTSVKKRTQIFEFVHCKSQL